MKLLEISLLVAGGSACFFGKGKEKIQEDDPGTIHEHSCDLVN